MKIFRLALYILVLTFVVHSFARADHPDDGGSEIQYDFPAFTEDVRTVKGETIALFSGISLYGVITWNWGSQARFKMNSEEWFDKDTGSGGTDKLGHAFSTFLITDVLSDIMIARGKQPRSAAASSALIAMGVMTYVEIFDGYSEDHGFSYEDMIMNSLGAGFAYLRNRHPRMREMVDFRLNYVPSGYKGFRPLSDYAGQKYLLAFKASGLPAVKRSNSLLRFLELHLGYYARGFTLEERREGLSKSTEHYVGIGLNLNELLFGRREGDSRMQSAGRLFFEHIQLPYTAVNHDLNEK